MKSMKMKFVAMMLIVVLALSGCMKMDVALVINPDASGSCTATVSIDKQAFLQGVEETYKDMGMSLSASELADMDKSFTDEGYKLVTIDGKEYYTMSESKTIKKGNLSKELSSEGLETYATADTIYMKVDAKALSGDMAGNMGASASSIDIASAMTYTMTVQFPAPIVATNGVVDSTNKNKVSFNLLSGASVFYATTKANQTQTSIKTTVDNLNKVNAPKIKKLKANKVKAKAKKATAALKISKVKDAKSYEVQYSTKKNFKNATTKTIKKATYTIKNLKMGKKYYVRVRAVKVNYVGKNVYSKWVKKTVKTKKAAKKKKK